MILWRAVAIELDELVASLVARQCIWPRGGQVQDDQLLGLVPWPPPETLEAFYGPSPAPVSLTALNEPRSGIIPGVLYRDYSFPGQMVSSFEEVNRGIVRRWYSRRPGTGLVVLMLPGLAQFNFFWFDRMGETLAAAGIEAWMMDEPYNFRRTPAGARPSQYIAGGPPRQLVAAFRYAICDARALIATLRQHADRVIVIGQSYGAWLSTILCLLESDICVFPVTPMGDVVRWYYSRGKLARYGRRRVKLSDRRELWRIARPINPAAWSAPAQPERIHFHISRYDRFLDPRLAIDLAHRWHSPYTEHPDGHVSIWLGKRLRQLLLRQVLECSRPFPPASGQPRPQQTAVQADAAYR